MTPLPGFLLKHLLASTHSLRRFVYTTPHHNKMATEGKEHLSIVICGHVDSGKSTTTGHLLFELGTDTNELPCDCER